MLFNMFFFILRLPCGIATRHRAMLQEQLKSFEILFRMFARWFQFNKNNLNTVFIFLNYSYWRKKNRTNLRASRYLILSNYILNCYRSLEILGGLWLKKNCVSETNAHYMRCIQSDKFLKLRNFYLWKRLGANSNDNQKL